MIIEEFMNDGTLVKHYSDNNKLLLQVETGVLYGEAVDVVPCKYTYEETDESMIDEESLSEEVEQKAAAYDILMGVAE